MFFILIFVRFPGFAYDSCDPVNSFRLWLVHFYRYHLDAKDPVQFQEKIVQEIYMYLRNVPVGTAVTCPVHKKNYFENQNL